MNNNRTLFFCLILILQIAIPLHADRYHRDEESSSTSTAVKVGVAGAVTGVVAGGAYALYNWWTTPTDAQALKKARDIYYATSNRYFDALNSAKIACGNTWHACSPQVSEKSLEQIAIKHIGTDEHTIDREIDMLNSGIHDLRDQNDALDAQIKRSESASAQEEMEAMRINLNALRQELAVIRDIFSLNRAYFKLRAITLTLGDRYAQESRACERYLHDRGMLREQLRGCIINKNHNALYPYLTYAEKLRSACDHIESSARTIAPSSYPELASQARSLIHILNELKALVHSDNEYLASLRDRDLKKLEQERIEAERRNTEARHRQARALERQNNIREREYRTAHHCCHPHCGAVCIEFVEVPVVVPADVHVGFNVGWYA